MNGNGSRIRSRRRFLECGAVAASALALGVGRSTATSTTDEHGLQQRVDEADEGDTLEVESGEYDGAVVVGKPLTLRGVGDPTVDASEERFGIAVRANDVTVEGFEVRGDGETSFGIGVVSENDDRSGVTVADNRVAGLAGSGGGTGRQTFGISSWGAHVVRDLTVENNRVEDIGGSNGEDPQGVGINLQSIDGDEPGAGGTVVDNEVSDLADGNLGSMFPSPEGFDRNVPPYGVALTVQPLDGDDSGAGSDGVLAAGNAFEGASVDVVLGNRSDPMTSRLTGNDFGEGDDVGIVNVGERVPAECNFWGDGSGPAHTRNLRGRGDIVLGPVDYRPWAREEVADEDDVSCRGGTDG